MHNILFASLLLIITLTSCSPSTALTPTVISSASPTARILVNTSHTPAPALTIGPSTIESPSPTAFNSLNSPSGEFSANAYFEYQLPSGMPAIEILDKEGKLIWQIPFQGEMPTSDPHRSLDIFQWSKDSSQLYFYYVLFPDGGDRAFWWTGFDLQTIDMKTGKSQHVLPGEGFMSFTISPDGTQIAYTRSQDNPSIIYIRNLSTGSEKTAYVIFGSKNYARVGDIHWSPSGKELAFQTESDDYIVQTIYLNLVTMRQKVIQEYKVFDIDFQGWTSEGKLEFREYRNSFSEIVQVDVSKNEMVIIGTPTRSP